VPAVLLIVFVAVLVFAARARPALRDSGLVRGGAVLFVVSTALLAVLPALVTGLLFAVLAPIGLLLVIGGSIMAAANSRRRVDDDIKALVAGAKSTGRCWPEDPPLQQVEVVAKHGLAAAHPIMSLLRFDSEEQLTDETWSPQLEQQAALALCKIYGETASSGRTVYDPRATPSENRRVKEFWAAKVHQR
jgi:hypothetical protein